MQYVRKENITNAKQPLIEENAALITVNDNGILQTGTKDSIYTYVDDVSDEGVSYVRRKGVWVALPDDSGIDTYMYYGYVEQAGVDNAEEITAGVINAAIESGTVKKHLFTTNTSYPIQDIPAGAFIVIAVPIGYTVSIMNNGSPRPVNVDAGSAGIGAEGAEMIINFEDYLLYSEFCIASGTSTICVNHQ